MHGLAILVNKKLLNTSNRFAVSVNQDLLTHADDGGQTPLIIRATDGKSKRQKGLKAKMSTIVQPNDIDNFYVRYADICKSGMAALKPRDRSKKKARAKKKKVMP